MTPNRSLRFLAARTLALVALTAPLSALNHPSHPPSNNSNLEGLGDDLTELSLEELMSITVTVASGSEQKLSEIPAAAYVLTGDEIRRAGHSSVQEALRMVPGFHVSHWSGDMWDVTARGYGNNLSLTNEAFLNQLLVMLDGVPIYSPLFGGIWWGLLDIPMEDIERIEIIRGPGGIVWGSNTVHGVVNIITRSSADTVGGLVSTWYGGEDQHYTARSGFAFGENGYMRVWAKQSEYEELRKPFAGYRNDWDLSSAGIRADWGDPEGWNFTTWGRFYEGKFKNIAFDLLTFAPFSTDFNKRGNQIAFRANNAESGDTFSAWYQQDRQNLRTLVDIDINQFDVEYKREMTLGKQNRLNVGLGFRQIDSFLWGDDPLYEEFDPNHVTQNNTRLFAVDTIGLPDCNAELVLGLQLIYEEFTGFDLMPSIRGSWSPEEDLFLWGGISRAVRTPSLEEVSLDANSVIVGDDDLDPEELLAYEGGARWQPSEELAIDVALFYNDYDDLQNTTFNGGTGQLFLGNDAEGHGTGYEIALDAKPTDRWSIRSTYSRLEETFRALNGSDTVIADRYSPRKTMTIRSYYDLTDTIEIDLGFYMVGDLEFPFNGADYKRGDARIGWHPSDEFELAVGVIGFDDSTWDEYTDFAAPNNQVRRQAYVSLTWTPWQKAPEE